MDFSNAGKLNRKQVNVNTLQIKKLIFLVKHLTMMREIHLTNIVYNCQICKKFLLNGFTDLIKHFWMMFLRILKRLKINLVNLQYHPEKHNVEKL